jgi:MFS family permease
MRSSTLLTQCRAYMLYLTTPLWVTELVPPRGRSILVGIVGLGGVVGYVLAAYVGVGFFYYGSEKSAQWRAPLSIGCLPPLLLIAFLPWLPESPRFLLKGDKTEKAWLIVRDLHATSADTEHEYAQAEFFQMRKQHELDTSLDGSWMAILKRRSYLKRAAIAFFLPVMLYSTGNLVVTSTYPHNPEGDIMTLSDCFHSVRRFGLCRARLRCRSLVTAFGRPICRCHCRQLAFIDIRRPGAS